MELLSSENTPSTMVRARRDLYKGHLGQTFHCEAMTPREAEGIAEAHGKTATELRLPPSPGQPLGASLPPQSQHLPAMVEAVVGAAALPFFVEDAGGSPTRALCAGSVPQCCLLSLGWSLLRVPNLWPGVLSLYSLWD